ncbi:MAG: serine/threonine protein kinase, partial [Acidobacteria bacterium]
KGVIHGDVKPANVLITDDGRVKLMDFGMARLASCDSAATPLVGTPAYWCPEQIMGKPQDARSDLFSLGVVLHEMVTGQRPFDADSLQGICGRVLSSTPLPPSHANPSLPAGFDEVVSRCLAKDPSARYATAEALAQDLYPLARRKPTATVCATARRVFCALHDDHLAKRPLRTSRTARFRCHESRRKSAGQPPGPHRRPENLFERFR